MPNNFPILVGSGATPTSGDYLVRFIDFDGTILKEQWVNAGQAATAPTPPTHQYLTFDEWNNDFANIQHDLDVGATYYTTDGKTYLFMRFTNTTGLQPAILLNKATTAQMNIDWGDGTGASLSGSGNITITKAAPYAAIGDYTITIECAGNYRFYTYIFNNNAAYNSSLLNCYLGKNVTSIGPYTFQQCFSLTSIVIPDGVTSIEPYTFYQCFSLTSIVIPDVVTSIGLYAFYQCYSLTSIVIPDGVTSIEPYTFYQCYSLTSIVIPDVVTSIGLYAFCHCFSLTSIVIPDVVTSIGLYAFYQNYSTLKYEALPTNPPSLANIDAFNSINSACKIYVPDASVLAYQAATNWLTYASYIYPISQLSEYAGTIFFQSNGGNAIKQITGTVGAVATEPTAPTKAGVTFAGWYKEAALTNPWNWASDVYPATNITLYAKWV
jgi:uncharacterized repeat protein (TIGR02543 family)